MSIARARSLRRRASYTETQLWKILRGRQLAGLKFRRQVPLGPYVVDFVCLRHRIIVEADGPFHDAERDALRDAWLTSQGFRILRIPNDDVLKTGHWVVQRIEAMTGVDHAVRQADL